MNMKLTEYLEKLVLDEKSPATVRQYEHEIRRFLEFLDGEELTKERVIAYKEELRKKFLPTTVNTKLAAINGWLRFLGLESFRVRRLRIQRSAYCAREKELGRDEYEHMIETAEAEGDERTALLVKTICSTGIRVSELSFITVEAARRGTANVSLKGKTRVIFLPEKLRDILKSYAQRRNIDSGPVFVTRTGRPLDRSFVWRLLKNLGKRAGLKATKVFPHNLRHLFARTFYQATGDVVKLADILGHSSIDTTRIYTVSSGREHQRMVEALGLI